MALELWPPALLLDLLSLLTPDSTGVAVQMANTVRHLLVSMGKYRPPRSAPNAPCIPSLSPSSPTHLSGGSGQSQLSTQGSQEAPGRMKEGEEHVLWTGERLSWCILTALLAFPSTGRDKRGVSVHHRRCTASQMTPPRAYRGAWETLKEAPCSGLVEYFRRKRCRGPECV